METPLEGGRERDHHITSPAQQRRAERVGAQGRQPARSGARRAGLPARRAGTAAWQDAQPEQSARAVSPSSQPAGSLAPRANSAFGRKERRAIPSRRRNVGHRPADLTRGARRGGRTSRGHHEHERATTATWLSMYRTRGRGVVTRLSLDGSCHIGTGRVFLGPNNEESRDSVQ